MKNWRKILTVLLAALLAFSTLAACGESTDIDLSDEVLTSQTTVVTGGGTGDVTAQKGGSTTNTTSSAWSSANTGAPQTNISDKDALGYDMKGETITIYGMAKPDGNKSKTDKAHADMIADIEKENNCKVVFEAASGDKVKNQTTLNVMSGTHFANLIPTSQYQVVHYSLSDLLTDLATVKTIDLNKGYMNIADGVNAFHYGSRFFAVNQPYSSVGSTHVMAFNKRIMKEVTNGDENYPYTLQSQGQWNIDKMRELAKQATKELDGNGTMDDNDQWGVSWMDSGYAGYNAFLQAERAQMLLNENGKIKYNMEDSKVLAAMNLATEFFYNDKSVRGNAQDAAEKFFANGKALFFGGGYIASIIKCADMKDDFGVIPFPLGIGQTEYSTSTNWNAQVFCIPACVPKGNALDSTGAFLQSYMLRADGELVPAYLDEVKLRYLRDDQSKDNIMTAYKSLYTTAASAVGNDGAILEGTWRAAYSAGTVAPATTIAQNKSKTVKAIDDLNAKFK